MARKTLGFFLVCGLACGAPAADQTAGHLNAVPVSELLARAGKSPLGPGEARLLRAVAELIDKEQAAAVSVPQPLPTPVANPQTLPPQERERLAIRLRNASVDEVIKSLREFLANEPLAAPADDRSNPNRLIVVPEQVTNTLLISGTPKLLDSLTSRIAKLDARPDAVVVRLLIADLVDDSAALKLPSPDEDGAAWLKSATEHGRLQALSRPQIMTLVNQPAFVQIGTRVASAARTGGPAQTAPQGLTNPQPRDRGTIGVTVGVTPKISPAGLIVLELDVEHASVVSRNAEGEPVIAKMTVQTTVTAKDGQTVVLGGIPHSSDSGPRRLILAVTANVNPPETASKGTPSTAVATPSTTK